MRAYTHMSATTTPKPKSKKSQSAPKAQAPTIEEALENAGFTSSAGKCGIVNVPTSEIRTLLSAISPAGAVANAKDLIALGSYVGGDRATTLIEHASEFKFDNAIVQALIMVRKDAHEGAEVERTDEKLNHARLHSDEIDALRKSRREASRAKRAEATEATASRTHGGAGEHIANFFTFGAFGRALDANS